MNIIKNKLWVILISWVLVFLDVKDKKISLRVRLLNTKRALLGLLRQCITLFIFLNLATNTAAGELEISRDFSPKTIHPYKRSTLIIELKNTSATPITDLSLSDMLPDGLFIVKGEMITSCGGMSAAFNTNKAGSFTVSDATISSRDSINLGLCTISLGVTTRSEGIVVTNMELADIKAVVNGTSISIQQDKKSTISLTAKISPITSQ